MRLLPIALFLTLLGTVAAASDWPMYQQNPAHTGYTAVNLNPAALEVRWEEKIGPLALTPAAVSGGRLFVSTTGYFSGQFTYGVDAADGTVLWSKDFGDVFSVNPPACADGKVYVQTGNHGSDTYLRAYDAATGAFVFQSPHAAQWERYFAPTPFAGKVYVNGGYYGGAYGFDGTSGAQEWFLDLPQYDQWTPAVDDDHVYAYVGEYSPGLYVADRATGVQEFMIPDPNFDWNGWSMHLAPVLGTQDDVLAIHDGRLISFDVVGRQIGWEIDETFTGQPSLAAGVIYCINAGALEARDEGTGTKLWSWVPPSGSLTGEIIVTDTHLLTRTSSHTYMVDLATHAEAWSVDRSGYLALDDTSLYVVWGDGWITAFDILDVAASAVFRNDAGDTNPTGYVASVPILGSPWTCSVDNSLLGNLGALVVGFAAPLEYLLPGTDDYLLVDVSDPGGELLQIAPALGYGVVDFSVPIPAQANLMGLSLCTQGVGFGGFAGTNLHNAYDLVLGTH